MMYVVLLCVTVPLQSQGTEEQKKKWLPLTQDHRILGGYAQTEMGHGMFCEDSTCSCFSLDVQYNGVAIYELCHLHIASVSLALFIVWPHHEKKCNCVFETKHFTYH